MRGQAAPLTLTSCRAGELSAQELEQLMVIVGNPRTFKIPDWFLNRCGAAALRLGALAAIGWQHTSAH